MKVNLDTPFEEVQIQIIPLIDVVFCILTFFLLAALQFTRQQAINVDLPKASTGTTSAASSQSRNNILPVTIDAVGQTYIEKTPVGREELAAKLRQYVQNNPSGILVLNASRTATYNDVIQTLDILREVGGNRVSLGIIAGSSQSEISSPNFPTAPLPNTVPMPEFNPSIPSQSNQIPRTGEGINPVNPGISPVFPNNSTPDTTSPAPSR